MRSDGDQPSDLTQYTVVFVDDEANILNSLRRLFHNEPFSFASAPSGEEALRLIGETPFVAAIVSDQRMPRMNGSEFLTKCREIAPDAVRMLLTGYSDMESTISAINTGGATHFSVKPWDDAQLLQTVRDAVTHYHLIIENRKQQSTIKEQNEKMAELLARLTAQNEELQRLASSDALTGMNNRRVLFESLGAELSRVRRYGGFLSLLMLDIDHFKRVNDTWGHAAGDDVLRAVARVVKRTVRDVDLSARYGGEEFVILLPETALEGAVQIAERLRLAVSTAPVTLAEPSAGQAVTVTVSIGVAEASAPESGEALISRADAAMYRAKEGGRNRVVAAAKAGAHEAG